MKRGDVELVYVPFVGSAGGKRRPAVVVQCDSLNSAVRETVIVEITSNLSNAGRAHQVLIDVTAADGANSGLLTNSAIRCERPHTIPQVDVLQTIGSLSAATLQRVDEALKSALGIA
jgi:mRNA-degrading endonuclease toxin of MazEF toxin-antitoxin module